MIDFNNEDIQELISKEWIVTNGIGGYASSSVTGTNTRRYHGILISSANPPLERMLMVSKVEERIIFSNREIRLSTNQYPQNFYPEGYRFIQSFERKPLPVTNFEAYGAKLSKSVFMVHGSNTTIIEYKNTSNIGYQLWLNPLYAGRDFHALLHERDNYDYYTAANDRFQAVYPSHGADPVFFRHTAGTFVKGPTWNKQLTYYIDQERGYDCTEDIYSTGYLSCMLAPGAVVHLVFSMDEEMMEKNPLELKEQELKRLKGLVPENVHNDFLADLITAGDQFIVKRKSTGGYSVIAGYHWFSDWGRDSMIALRGLCIATGKQEEAASIIRTFLEYLKEGLIPNRFPDYKDDLPEYITIDATLWLFISVYEYDQKFNDKEFLQSIYPKLQEILDHHIKGTMHNIHVTEKGFIAGGENGIPLTWMDARINEYSFTARAGCPVEIQALWYNALKIFVHVSEKLGEAVSTTITDLTVQVKTEFERAFWNDECYLNDLVTEENEADPTVRPNQIYAISLPFRLLDKEKEKMVLDNIAENLVTPVGLRTLETYHFKFKCSYSGDVWSRDAAYHQGTVWPFLLPEYLMAYLRVNDHSDDAKRKVQEHLKALKKHFYEAECLHAISEVFDGIEPKEGKGCIHQAWSVSNLILLLINENLEI
ncbi:MAG: glycogen debranching protein [Bacteroidota bacterium]|jgi:predicted glycogen debranching enzyme|nr:glycogen debranching protein [Bacteroidota bacterium]